MVKTSARVCEARALRGNIPGARLEEKTDHFAVYKVGDFQQGQKTTSLQCRKAIKC